MSDKQWVLVLPTEVTFSTLYKTLPTKGNLAWEYNPLRNYRLSQTMYEYKGDLYPEVPKGVDPGATIKRKKGELVDFITNELSFSLEHPVSIVPLYSYDGSVNLILNDGINTPKLINTRFSTTGKDTYEIINRRGDGDTNIYDLGDQFDIDTSLYKKVNLIPKLQLHSISSGGNLKVGNYHFYFTYTDADGNETDIVAESGLVSLFIGLNDPSTIHTGNRNENSLKLVSFILTNIDSAYEYVLVYYSRCYAEDNLNALTSYIKINKKFLINNRRVANILITGYDEELEVTSLDINPIYNIVDSAKALATAKNMLFLGNVHKPTIPYLELEDLSLRFLPYLKNENYSLLMDETYNITSKSKGYYDPKFIYEKVGYWEEDLYRLGVVYILSNNELTPVFNIRGGLNIPEYNPNDHIYNEYLLTNLEGKRIIIQSNEETNYIITPEPEEDASPSIPKNIVLFENTKGVVSVKSNLDTNTIHAIEIRSNAEQIERLKSLGIKGFFFVRQKRMPLTLCLGITIATDNTSHTPTIPAKGEIINDVISDIENSYLEFDYDEDAQLNKTPSINYVSEGFLSRYKYKAALKEETTWQLVGKIATGIAIIAVLAAATIFTCGAAGITAVSMTGAVGGLLAVSSAVTAIGGTGAAIIGITAVAGLVVAGATSAINTSVRQKRAKKAHKSYKGREEVNIPDKCVQQELENSRLLNASFAKRVIIKGLEHNLINAILCPEYDVNSTYFNQIFTGLDFTLKTSVSQAITWNDGEGYFLNNNRHFYIPSYYDSVENYSYSAKIQAVPDNVKVVTIGTQKFRSRAGWAEEAWRYESVGGDYSHDLTKLNGDVEKSNEKDENGDKINVEQTLGQINSDIIRGEFGPYLGMVGYDGDSCETVSIMIPGYKESALEDYIKIRINDNSSFYAISDRLDITDLNEFSENSALVNDSSNTNNYSFIVHRGDCYICLFTHRINRNFKDPNSPYNDVFVDPKTWRNNYTPLHSENYATINLGDVNAVELGMWCTFRVRSSMNLNIRSLDNSNVAETAMMGHAKGFYPYLGMITEGTYKSEEALCLNKGFTKSLSERYNFTEPDVPAVKNWFGTRIMYSDIQVNDAFKNNFRVFKNLNYRDYTRLYGEITKLINYNDNLFVVFEHGLALATVNEKMVAALSTTNIAYVTTKNVLPEDLTIISETFGSQWPESVIITPHRGDVGAIIFGIDTVGKKIWQYSSSGFKIISDFKVLEFLNNNITLGEREKTPILGIRNVKSFYNAYKQDVLFTFYDNLSGFNECVWNLCYNIPLGKFITFYSWVPSMMENIDNIPFSFNRATSKWISKLGMSHASNSFARGITLSNNIYSPITDGIIGELSLADNILLPTDANAEIIYEWQLCRDIWGNYKNFTIEGNLLKFLDSVLTEIPPEDETSIDATDYPAHKIVSLGIAEYYYRNKAGNYYGDWETNKVSYKDLVPDTPLWEDLAAYYMRAKNLPIYKAKNSYRPTLDFPINSHNLVQLLNIKCIIKARYEHSSETLVGTQLDENIISIGEYESTIAVTSDWNLLFLSTDFWKHGLAGLIDICDDIKPTYWYGEQHPFEFEVIVVGDPAHHKIFRNLEIIANKALPESFHYEIIGECYDFAKDKKNMYFRQEARKALFLYNGLNITYDPNFTKILPELFPRSTETILYYLERHDTLNDIYDFYAQRTSSNKDYRNLSGTEVVYYKNRLEYRLWSHQQAINLNELSQDRASSLLRGNCAYQEDKWLVTINPILIALKNEYARLSGSVESLCSPNNSTWARAASSEQRLPPIVIRNTSIPEEILLEGTIEFPGIEQGIPLGVDNTLFNLYDLSSNPIDFTNWLHISRYSEEEAHNRQEIDLKDKFMKVKIRYSGTELAVIDVLNTLYEVSFS